MTKERTENPQRIYKKNEKSVPGWGYWGNFGEIEIGLSSGREESTDNPQIDKLHYHKEGIIYILALEGKGIVEIEGENVTVTKDEVLRIAPGEKYRHIGVQQAPFSWITICTSKKSDDKVVIEKS
jgi:mannose-6-phosphate isomerase-like protein (cupin superfamily)